MSAICNNCGAAMPDIGYRACEACRAEWRHYARKPNGPAEQREALIALIAAAKDTARILDAVRLSAGLGKSQIERLEKTKAAIARAEKVLAS